MESILKKFKFNDDLKKIIDSSEEIIIPKSRKHLLELALIGEQNGVVEVSYDVPGKGKVVEATVTRAKNGAVVNYVDPYMRRRDPNCLLIADDKATDKETYEARFGEKFDSVRQATFDWFKDQKIILLPFMSGDDEYGYPSVLISPLNAAFFAAGLADLQGFIPVDEIPDEFDVKAVVYLAPTFRHTHYEGKQVVVHNRLDAMHEVFSFNLYPGPSAKKGIYSVLLNLGESEGWTTAHASTVRVITPYDNTVTIMHEGASGGGKSEMIEEVHREVDGRVIYGTNTLTNETIDLEISDTCALHPVTDDMALCHRDLQNGNKLVVKDAEAGWFLRVDHITKYGTSPQHEKLCIHPQEPLIFFNMQASPDATCLLWEHIEDAPNKPCPNPRVIMPRHFVPDVVDEAAEIDIRSFGFRAPACTKEQPSYGIVGGLHVLPPALAWLWRLVAPRGHANPSIMDSDGGMKSEGVGSYWPFATGKMVDQANILLDQVVNTPGTKYVLIPNQHIGAYKVGFAPEWIAREYLARRGSAKFKPEQLTEARCSLLGYSLSQLKVDGKKIPKGMLQTNLQPEVGNEGYDEGAKILTDFFKKETKKFLTPDLNPLGRQIIECCLNDGSIQDYIDILPM